MSSPDPPASPGLRAKRDVPHAPRIKSGTASVEVACTSEILLPLCDNEGRRFGRQLYAEVREALVERFSGLTAFTRSPAEGLWEEDGERSRDEIIIFEVMADELDRGWWRSFRDELERRFQQDEIVVRAREAERL